MPVRVVWGDNKIGMLLQWGVLTPEDILRYRLVDIPHAAEILADREELKAMAPPEQMEMPPGALGPEAGAQPPDMDAEIAQLAAESGLPPELLMQMLEEEQGAVLG